MLLRHYCRLNLQIHVKLSTLLLSPDVEAAKRIRVVGEALPEPKCDVSRRFSQTSRFQPKIDVSNALN